MRSACLLATLLTLAPRAARADVPPVAAACRETCARANACIAVDARCIGPPLVPHPRSRLARLLRLLGSSDEHERGEAADGLRDGGVPTAAVPALLSAAKHERKRTPLVRMIGALGESGMLEALGLIQTHALSPDDELRGAGRNALRAWLVRNGLLGEDGDMPEPPHLVYAHAPRVPPDRPAAHAAATWASMPPGARPLGPSEPAPRYEAPDPDGVPPGFHTTEVARRGLVIGGALTLGILYAASAVVGGFVSAGNPDDAAFGALLAPVAGPFIVVGTAGVFDRRGRHADAGLGVGLIIDGIGQSGGLAMLIAGLHARKTVVVSDEPETAYVPAIELGPTGVTARCSW